MNEYRVIDGFDDPDMDDAYERWLRPDGSVLTVITEPEDRCFFRDLAPLLDELNRLRGALDHAMKGDMDPEDRVIIAQILYRRTGGQE